ncbi:MAG: hypothetical protein WHS38_02155 [Thermodesulforhabdaceae bacterium]|jgi:hypothetical protein
MANLTMLGKEPADNSHGYPIVEAWHAMPLLMVHYSSDLAPNVLKKQWVKMIPGKG